MNPEGQYHTVPIGYEETWRHYDRVLFMAVYSDMLCNNCLFGCSVCERPWTEGIASETRWQTTWLPYTGASLRCPYAVLTYHFVASDIILYLHIFQSIISGVIQPLGDFFMYLVKWSIDMYHKLTVCVKSRYNTNLFPTCCFGDQYHKYEHHSINTLQISFIFYTLCITTCYTVFDVITELFAYVIMGKKTPQLPNPPGP